MLHPPKSKHLAAGVTLLLLLAAAPAAAQTNEQEALQKPTAPPVLVNSVNVNPLGVAFGNYAVNYERLFGGYHGLLVEGTLSMSSDKESNNTTYGGLVGYRFHWSGEQDSGFLGLSVAYGIGSGDSTVTVNGGTEKAFVIDSTYLGVTANVGRRWAWDFGLNITLRGGIGYGSYSVSTESEDPDAKLATELVDALLTFFPIAIESELSVGWCF